MYEYIYAVIGRIQKKLERVIPLAWKMEIGNGRKDRQGEKKTYFCYYNLLNSFLNMFMYNLFSEIKIFNFNLILIHSK